MAKIIYTDLKKCMGCKSCELACAIAHSRSKNLLAALMEETKPLSRVKVVSTEGVAVPIQCMHCEDSPCVRICPTRALSRPAGVDHILFRREFCIGCHSCVLVCPFGAAQQRGSEIVRCDLCIDRLEGGEKPACIIACPVACRTLVSSEEVAARKRRAAAAEMKKGLEAKAPARD